MQDPHGQRAAVATIPPTPCRWSSPSSSRRPPRRSSSRRVGAKLTVDDLPVVAHLSVGVRQRPRRSCPPTAVIRCRPRPVGPRPMLDIVLESQERHLPLPPCLQLDRRQPAPPAWLHLGGRVQPHTAGSARPLPSLSPPRGPGRRGGSARSTVTLASRLSQGLNRTRRPPSPSPTSTKTPLTTADGHRLQDLLPVQHRPRSRGHVRRGS